MLSMDALKATPSVYSAFFVPFSIFSSSLIIFSLSLSFTYVHTNAGAFKERKGRGGRGGGGEGKRKINMRI